MHIPLSIIHRSGEADELMRCPQMLIVLSTAADESLQDCVTCIGVLDLSQDSLEGLQCTVTTSLFDICSNISPSYHSCTR